VRARVLGGGVWLGGQGRGVKLGCRIGAGGAISFSSLVRYLSLIYVSRCCCRRRRCGVGVIMKEACV
jgi:hypothetical protein